MANAIERSVRRELWLGAGLLLAGLVVSGAALSVMLSQSHRQVAQTNSAPTAQSTPSTNVDQKNPNYTAGPKQAAPEPARPSEGTTGSSPASPRPAVKGDALPPAPAEKIGDPISPK